MRSSADLISGDRELLVERILAQLAGRQDKTLTYLQLAIGHGLIPAPAKWYGNTEAAFAPLLAPGMQTMALGDLYRLTVRKFEDSMTRRRLWGAIERFHSKIARFQVATELWLAGSFLSVKPEPADVDGALVLATERVATLTPRAAVALDEMLDDAKRSKLDLALIFEGDLATRAYVQGFLGFSGDRRTAAGIAVISLR